MQRYAQANSAARVDCLWFITSKLSTKNLFQTKFNINSDGILPLLLLLLPGFIPNESIFSYAYLHTIHPQKHLMSIMTIISSWDNG